jgi:hypothetical protein
LLLLPAIALGQGYPGANNSTPQGAPNPPNDPPVWHNDPPEVVCVEGTASSKSLVPDDVSDPDGDTLTLTNEGAALPTGVTLDDANDEVDCATNTTVGTTSGIVFGADDGTAPRVDTSSFSVVVTGWDAMSPSSTVVDGFAIHGADWSTYIATGPTVVYHRVTTTATTGAGSFGEARTNCSDANLDVILFETSGTITYSANTFSSFNCDNVIIAANTAPSPGIHFRGVKWKVDDATRQLWMHYSCFADANVEASGGCLQIGGSIGTASDIVVMNYGSVFNYDAGMNVFKDASDVSFVQGMSIYPIDLSDGENPEVALIGVDDGTSDDVTYIRNVGAHTQDRCPMWVGETDGTIANNVFYNCTANLTSINSVDTAGTVVNILDNMYVRGPDGGTGNAIKVPIVDIASVQIDAAMTIARDGNCAFGAAFDDSTQAALTNDRANTTPTYESSANATGHVTGFVSTDIGSCTAANEKSFAVDLVCANAGPRPEDQLSIYSDICDQIAAKFDGVGDEGGRIGPASDIGYPTVAVNTCDLDTANNCYSGFPALPDIGTVTAQGIIDYVNDTHCALMPAGATGC